MQMDVNDDPENDPLMLDSEETQQEYFESIYLADLKTELHEQPGKAGNLENDAKQVLQSSENEILEEPTPFSSDGLGDNVIHHPSSLEIKDEHSQFSSDGLTNVRVLMNDLSNPDKTHEETTFSHDLQTIDEVTLNQARHLLSSTSLCIIRDSEKQESILSDGNVEVSQPEIEMEKDSQAELCNCVICEKILPNLCSIHLRNQLKQEILNAGKPALSEKFLQLETILMHSNKNIPNIDTKLFAEHHWLTGCEVLNKIFCWPCLLTGMKIGSYTWNPNRLSGLKSLRDSIRSHSKSKLHLRACISHYSTEFTQSKVVDSTEKNDHNAKVNNNRAVLRRLIDAVCLLPKLEMSFCDADESETSPIHRIFLDIVNTMSEYDLLLKMHFNSSLENDKLTTSEVRCGLIKAIGTVLVDKIKEEVNNATFVSIILDSTSSLATFDDSLISASLRYVDKDGFAKERLVGYFNGNATSFSFLYDTFLSLNTEFKINNKLVAISFGSIAISPDNLTQVVSKIQIECSSALLVHSNFPRLNPVLQKYCQKFTKCRIFFATLSRIAMFFSKSAKRRELFASFLTSQCTITEPIELNFALCKEKTIYDHQLNLIKFFDDVIENPYDWDEEEIVGVQGFRSFLSNFSSTFLLLVFARLFEHTNNLHMALAVREFDIDFCTNLVVKASESVSSEHANFYQFWDEARERTTKHLRLKNQWNVEAASVFESLFKEIIDVITTHLADRRLSLQKLTFFKMLNPDYFPCYNLHFPEEHLKMLAKTYPHLFGSSITKHQRNEISALYCTKELANMLPHELAPYIKSLNLQQSFSEAYKLWCLFLTLPNTKGSLEAKFSVWERMKFVRDMLGHQTKLPLSLLTTENRFLTKLRENSVFYSDVTEELIKNLQIEALRFR